MDDLRKLIRDIPDFPEPGIVFKDITPVLGDPEAWQRVVNAIAAGHDGDHITKVVGIESRGFIVAAPVAAMLGAGFVPVRKAGKLPYRTVSETYQLEYGTDTLEIHEDAVTEDDMVLIVDDVLATGGTAAATIRLVEALGAEVVGVTVMVELAFLGGRAKLGGAPLRALVSYDGS